jgi:cell division protease FtsH
MEKHHKFSMWYVLLGIWVVLILHNILFNALSIQTIPYSDFLRLLQENKISEVAVSSNLIEGRISDGEEHQGRTGLFRTIRVDPDISELLQRSSV